MNKVVKRLVGYALPPSAEEMRSRMGKVIEYSSEVRDVVAPFQAPILAACPSLQTVFDLVWPVPPTIPPFSPPYQCSSL